MKRFLTLALLIGIAAFTITGCRTSPVYNVQEATIVTVSDKTMSLDDVRNAIVRAGGALGWSLKDAEPGHMIGTLNLREHMAQVDITFDTKSYSITYKDSQNLKYDGTTIHSNYNGWIQRLQQGINTQLSGL